MKYIKFLPLFLILLGCNGNPEPNKQKISSETNYYIGETSQYYTVREILYKNHSYIFLYGTSLVHSESCPCKNKVDSTNNIP